jgi:hypothetical protein
MEWPVIIRAGSGKERGYLVQGKIVGIVIRKAKDQITRPGIRYNEKIQRKRSKLLERLITKGKRDFVNHRGLLGRTPQWSLDQP